MTRRNPENTELDLEQPTHRTRRILNPAEGLFTQEMQSAARWIEGAGRDIRTILKKINEITFRTEIIALNATSEAARLDEADAGFATVAREVHALARRCAAVAGRTSLKIERFAEHIQPGKELETHASKDFDEIQEETHRLECLVADIATATHELKQGASRINSSADEVDTKATALHIVSNELNRLVDDGYNVSLKSFALPAASHNEKGALGPPLST